MTNNWTKVILKAVCRIGYIIINKKRLPHLHTGMVNLRAIIMMNLKKRGYFLQVKFRNLLTNLYEMKKN
ncbi:MAG: hypothetical protein GYA02_17220 [Clostridiaceae bacterium]|nr:hypothetical protein [Clostridiaceae bacterium]